MGIKHTLHVQGEGFYIRRNNTTGEISRQMPIAGLADIEKAWQDGSSTQPLRNIVTVRDRCVLQTSVWLAWLSPKTFCYLWQNTALIPWKLTRSSSMRKYAKAWELLWKAAWLPTPDLPLQCPTASESEGWVCFVAHSQLMLVSCVSKVCALDYLPESSDKCSLNTGCTRKNKGLHQC